MTGLHLGCGARLGASVVSVRVVIGQRVRLTSSATFWWRSFCDTGWPVDCGATLAASVNLVNGQGAGASSAMFWWGAFWDWLAAPVAPVRGLIGQKLLAVSSGTF